MAYVVVAIFLLCGGFTLLTAVTWGENDPYLTASMVAAVFSDDLTGNLDFAISASFTVACTTLSFALVMIARLEFVRWFLGFIGGVTALYYLYAVIWLLANNGEEVVLLPIVAFLLWTAGTVIVLLPVTAKAMRGYQSKPSYGHY